MAKTRRSGGRPARYEIRELRAADLGNGFLETLGNLSDVEGLAPKEAREILRAMRLAPLYHILVAVAPEGGIVGTTTLLVEQKFIQR